MDIEQARNYVRVWIDSGGKNPSEAQFRKDMAMLKNDILDQLAAYCDLLIKNFTATFGPDAPGLPIVRLAKQIILSSKS
jgi:hypothetical protein